MKKDRYKYRLYVQAFLTSAMAFLSGLFLINALIDPLWYINGNQLQPFNLSFNERASKINRYLKNPAQYDCIIFGSSVVTLLDESKIEDFRCFNFSFSAGNVHEFISYAQYIKALGAKPKLVIVGVDYFNFMDEALIDKSPDFVKAHNSPPSVLSTYLSYDSFRFSVRSLQRRAPRNRNYDTNFIGFVSDSAKSYDPSEPRESGDDFSLYYSVQPLSSDNTQYYKELRSIFSDAKYIGYVPLKSGWDTQSFMKQGYLENALSVMYETNRVFDEFYDFSVPSVLAFQRDDTYDGYHYGRKTTNHVLNGIFYGVDLYHIQAHELSEEGYMNAYIEQVKLFK
ncbi:MAG: hypothetical protein ACRBDL_00785 [Alphaproteobacteria bacterium]